MSWTTQKDLDGLVSRLNRITESPAEYSTKLDGVYKANIGHYHLDCAYGGVKLARTITAGGGIRTPVSMGYESKKDAYYIIAAFISGIEEEQAK
jgi:hypothetical protein